MRVTHLESGQRPDRGRSNRRFERRVAGNVSRLWLILNGLRVWMARKRFPAHRIMNAISALCVRIWRDEPC